MARPTIFTKKLGERICELIEQGKSVREICRGDTMPEAKSIYNWLRDVDKEWFLQHYMRAMSTRAELIAEEIIELSDTSVEDIEGDDKSDGARVQARKLQVDTRKWVLSKMLPKKYGDKLDLTSDGEKLPTPIYGGASAGN